jgi:hypothetical protein
VADEESTSTPFNQNIEVVVAVKGACVSSAATSPEAAALKNDVTRAPVCWLGFTSAAGM